MPTSPDPFDEFVRQIDSLMRSRKYPDREKSPALYESLELTCLAGKRDNDWVLISGKAALTTRTPTDSRLKKIVHLYGLAAYRGCIAAGELGDLITNLRQSGVLKWENIRLTSGRTENYRWMPPRVVDLPPRLWRSWWRLPENDAEMTATDCAVANGSWTRPFILFGSCPNFPPILSEHALEKIDRELRSGAPAFDGFDGLCAHLGLAVGRPPVASSFQLSAELPASVVEVFLKDWCELIVGVECLGTPAVMVEWLPGHELQRVEGRWFRSPTCNNCLSIKVPPDAEEARFILTFEDLQADVSRVKITHSDESDWQDLEVERETPANADFLIRKAPSQPELAIVLNEKARNRGKPALLAKYRSGVKKGILLQLVKDHDAGGLKIVRGLDEDGVGELPKGWKKSPEDSSFEDAYNDDSLKEKIDIEISKVRADMRKEGIL